MCIEKSCELQLLPGLIKSERPKSISLISASSRPEVKRKFCYKHVKGINKNLLNRVREMRHNTRPLCTPSNPTTHAK